MESLVNEVLGLLQAAPNGTMLYSELYESVNGRNVSQLPSVLKKMRGDELITKGIVINPETGKPENRVTLVVE